MFKKLLPVACAVLLFPSGVQAEETRLSVRALTQDAKFIGTSMAGMAVVIEDADTGEILDTGVTEGTTGNTDRILFEDRGRYEARHTPGSAVYDAVLEIEKPRRVRVTVKGPIGQPQAMAEASSTRWVLPGRHVTGGDGWLLVVPGFAVDVLAPGAHRYFDGVPGSVDVTANVVMICGCPTEPGGTWDADAIEVVATVTREGAEPVSYPLAYAGRQSTYTAPVAAEAKGVYQVLVTAFDPRNGNSGVDRTIFIVR